MKKILFIPVLLLVLILCSSNHADAQSNSTPSKSFTMKTYLIEREIPGAGNLTAAELKSISQTSCGVLKEMGPEIKWIHSYVVKDKIFCVYQAANEELIREHGSKGGFPVNTILEIENTISPATAN